MQYSYLNADVWYSYDATVWYRVDELTGDFYLQNTDVIIPGPVAPWYQRYGHSVDVVPALAQVDWVRSLNASCADTTITLETDPGCFEANATETQAMVMCGGFAPNPVTDVWVSLDGTDWQFIHAAPWSARGWHAHAVFRGVLYIIGGSPLSNDVWEGHNLTRSEEDHEWSMDWRLAVEEAPWMPRAASAAVTQEWVEGVNETVNGVDVYYEADRSTLYLLGGYGAWPAGHNKR